MTLDRTEKQELNLLMRRFATLSTRAQLEAFDVIRTYLAEPPIATADDEKIEEQKAALAALKRVAEELNLPAGQAPTTKQFDEVSKRLRLGWSSSRVTRAWERWRFACDAFTGRVIKQTVRQHGLIHARVGKRVLYESPLASVQLWLDTVPTHESVSAYDNWVREFNQNLPEGQARVLLWASVSRGLKVSFADTLRVARGAVRLADCEPARAHHRQETGPLASLVWIAGEFDVHDQKVLRLTLQPDFPAPVLSLSRTRCWLKEDVAAYFAKRPFPARESYELQDEYLSAAQLGKLMGKSPNMLSAKTTRRPEPAGFVSSRQYWRKSDVERWLKEEQARAKRRMA